MTGRAYRRAAAVVATVAAGALAGQVVASGPEPDASRTVRVGEATVVVPSAWRVLDAPAGEAVLARGAARMTVAFAPPGDASLVPPALARRVHAAPRPTQLGGYRAWSYRGAALTVLPTSRGVVGVACAGDAGRCASAVRSVSVPRAAVLDPAPDVALKLRAPDVLAGLDALRTRTRDALRNADPQTQARLSREAAQAHEAALEALRPFASGGALTRALADAARAYSEFAGAVQGGAAVGSSFDAARAGVAVADAALTRAVARLAATGAPSVQQRAAVAPAPAAGGVSAVTLALILVLGLLAVGLVPALAGRRRKSVPEPEEACVLAPIRRRLTTPPPTRGRWYEPPTGYGGRDGAPATARADHGDVVESVNVRVLP